jgi:PHD/YefM family antitoxin component YafN of YafNO toxin-antitoxin module
MIEITEQQLQQLGDPAAGPLRLVNPDTQEAFVLLRAEDFERLQASAYDDSPWTRAEITALAWQTGRAAGWDSMDEYDNLPDGP